MTGKHISHTLFAGLASLMLSGCGEQNSSTPAAAELATPSTEAAPEKFTIAATVKDIMVGAIEPSSNAIWAIGMDENIPQSDADWQALEFEVLQLMAASAAISLGGNGPKDAAWAENDAWQAMTQQMANISADILIAVRARDYDAALEASNYLIEPCGACHSAFPGESSL